MDDETLRAVLAKAVTAAINEMGMAAFKRTSFFMSNRKES
ncbi:hypothetical protein GGE68_002914 [Rhizobium leguminosarum]|nr:hypothetical protein [Rhizobium leguminosarum]